MSNGLRGVWAAAVTPMHDDLTVDLDRLTAHYRWLLAQGCDGVAALGTTGEANSFSLKERLDVIEHLSGAGLGMERILVGTGCCAIPDTVKLTEAALAAGAAGALMLPPFYYKGVSDDGLFAAFSEVIQRVGNPDLKIYVYDFPAMTGVEMSVDFLVRLHGAYPDTVVGVKDSSGNWPAMQAVCAAIPGFGTFAGTEQYLLPVLRAGGAGCISATANVTAAKAAEVYAQRDSAEADRLQDELTALRLMLQGYPLIPCMKEVLARLHDDPAWRRLRPPLVNLPAEKAQALFHEIDAARFAPAAAA